MKTILLVDDEYALVSTLADLLGEEGYRVVSAGNGRDGLARLQKEAPDLVITDLMMPISGGRELVLAMRALPAFRSTPVVLTSASNRTTAMADGRGGTLDVSAFLQKPFSWQRLRQVVVELIGKGEAGP